MKGDVYTVGRYVNHIRAKEGGGFKGATGACAGVPEGGGRSARAGKGRGAATMSVKETEALTGTRKMVVSGMKVGQGLTSRGLGGGCALGQGGGGAIRWYRRS